MSWRLSPPSDSLAVVGDVAKEAGRHQCACTLWTTLRLSTSSIVIAVLLSSLQSPIRRIGPTFFFDRSPVISLEQVGGWMFCGLCAVADWLAGACLWVVCSGVAGWLAGWIASRALSVQCFLL